VPPKYKVSVVIAINRKLVLPVMLINVSVVPTGNATLEFAGIVRIEFLE